MPEQELIPQEPVTDPEIKTIKEAAEEYINSLVFTNTKASTTNVYTHAIQIAVDYFRPQRPIAAITLPQVGKFFVSDKLLKLPNGNPRADLTVKQIKRVFRQCMEFALAKGWVTDPLPIPKAEMEHARSKAPQLDNPEPEPTIESTQI